MKPFFTVFVSAVALLTGCFSSSQAPKTEKIFYQADFSKGPDGWKSTGSGAWSPLSPVPGKGGSLYLRCDNDSDAKIVPKWVSPVIRTDGKALKLSFKGADNYLKQQDFSYAGTLIVNACDANGNPEGPLDRIHMEWDPSVKSPFMWGKRTRENLIWKYYEMDLPAGHAFLQLEFTFPAAMVRGSAYISHLLITESNLVSKTSSQENKQEISLLLSSPAVGGLFYEKDSFRFDALIFRAEPSELKLPDDAALKVSVRDFEKNLVASETFPLADAKKVSDPRFFKSAPAARRGITQANHRVKRFVLGNAEAKVPGILYRLTAELVSGGKTLASDTTLYGAAEYFDASGKNPSDSYFYTRSQGARWFDSFSSANKELADQDFTRKMRSVRSCELSNSYNWRKLQPVYPGPISQKRDIPEFPMLTYMPNIEQVHTTDCIPDGAQIPLKEYLLYTGRKNKVLTDYKVDAYADFILEYIRIHKDTIDWVVPSGLERPFSMRMVELQKKVYSEVKKCYPEMKVGFCCCFISVDQFRKYELYKYADFLTWDMYGANAGFPFNEEVMPFKEFYKNELKKPVPPLVLTEGALRTAPGHLNYAAGTARGIMSLLECGFYGIYYYHQRNMSPLKNPDLSDTLTSDPQSPGFDNYRFVQLVDRPVMAPEVAMLPGNEAFRWRDHDGLGAGASILPTLSTMVYYNLIKDFDWTQFKTARIYRGCKIYTFENPDRTVCSIDPLEGFPPERLLVESDSPYLYRDIFGRATRIVPVGGKSFIQLSDRPASLIFERQVKKLGFKTVDTAALKPMEAFSGGEFTLGIASLPFRVPNLKASLRVSGETPVSFEAAVDENGAVAAKSSIPRMAPGTYPARVFLRNGEAICGILHGALNVPDTLKFSMNPRVKTPSQQPGIEVIVENSDSKAASGKVVFENRWLTPSPRPETVTRTFRLGPGEKTCLFFPVETSMVKPNFNEILEMKVIPDSGKEFFLREKIHFRASLFAGKPIKVDGDLSDWPLDRLTPMPLERVRMLDTDMPAPDTMESPGQFYTVWRDNTLYMAMVVKDATPQSRASDINLWMDDNFLLGIYPWRYRLGGKFHSGYYREHLGFHKDGTVGLYRDVAVPSGASTDVRGVQRAIKRTKDGYVYEIAYPAESLYPLQIKPGEGFRLSLTYFDAMEHKNVLYFHGQLYYFGGATVNFHTDPNMWLEFIFAE